MDLKGNKITVKELTSIPAAMAIFEREFGAFAHHPMIKMFSSMPLSKLLKLAKKHIPDEQVARILNELEKI